MIIIETCPKCGHDLIDTIIYTYPPIPRKECPSCGWSWEGEREEVVRVPFGGNSLEMANDNSYLNNFLKMGYSEEDSNTLADLTVDSAGLYDNNIDITEAVKVLTNDLEGSITFEELSNQFSINSFENAACEKCSNHPKNGGSGICNCILGLPEIT